MKSEIFFFLQNSITLIENRKKKQFTHLVATKKYKEKCLKVFGKVVKLTKRVCDWPELNECLF